MLMHGFLTKSGKGWVLPDKVACYATYRRGLWDCLQALKL